ncbi:uncharacterized protein LOC107843187 [Capsicum annuum]|uniref:uncharacterized protein LOC107843187 n=1 Tax=Capsicum annuum TaxID=4072 RepID=UPI001FB0679A|nr:uncharacterized protein LOC107843187 [Capsicum annuum]XP_047255363.1 uncharacterized protein LOC107843187 [Capsicum annuum]XP_047255365.1 uncharacterized protein LOC107843187 [Capsicum annuum]XP_047255367.1 uncharacterized protein LOC107843187 [Capsicum annuum]XP_047255373.1 uncharacterized protein LOC107843187 [Capsicum annuum]XP_047255375.1 uncharacterized protein LOC107843187 [Capsicum annuum]
MLFYSMMDMPRFKRLQKKQKLSPSVSTSQDSRNNVKKFKVKAKEVLNLTGEERIVVNFEVYEEPFGEARSLLSRFCEILACDCSLFQINFEKWSILPMTYFNRIFEHTIKMDETGQWPGRAQMYITTHKSQDGVYVNEAAKEICEKIESTLSQSTIDESQVFSNDVISKVLGPDHSRWVRCLGLGVVPSRVFK